MKKLRFWLSDKKIRVAALLLVTVFSVFVSSTLAYFIASTNEIENAFYLSGMKIVVKEDFIQSDGGYLKQNVRFENVRFPGHSTSAYVRVKLVLSWRTADGNIAGVPMFSPAVAAALQTVGFYENPNFQQVKENIDDDENMPTGYFYYKGILNPGQETPPLAQQISVDYSALVGTVYENLTMEMSLFAEGIEAENGVAEAAWGMTYDKASHNWFPVAP